MKYYLLSILSLALFSCGSNNEPGRNDKIVKPQRPSPDHQSVGSLSFKLNGKPYEADPAHAKAWTTTQIPLAMMIAKGEGISVSMQIQNMQGKGSYKLDGDSKGTISFTVEGKTYWTRSVTGKNYLDLEVTSTKKQGTVVLLSGTFSGVIEGNDGVPVQITEGKFTTESL